MLEPNEHFPTPDQHRTVVDNLDHCEGVAYDPTRHCLWGGGEQGQLYRIPLDGSAVEQVATAESWILALVVDGLGRVVFCTAGDVASISVWDGERVSRVCDESDGLVLPNSLAFGDDATLYITDSGHFGEDDGRVLALSPDCELSVLSKNIRRFPNGCAVSGDGEHLYVVESFAPGVTSIHLSSGAEEVVATITDTVPDGIAVTSTGQLVVTSYRPDRVYLVDRSGSTELIAQDPWGAWLNAPTNACFAGNDLDRLIVTSFGRWHMTEIDSGLSGARPFAPTNWAYDKERR